MQGLLDDDLLSDAHEVVVNLRPERVLRLVSTVEEAVDTVTFLCQVWGGTGAPLVPISADAADEYLLQAALDGEVDGVLGELPDAAGASRYLEDVHRVQDYPAAMIAAHKRRDEYRPIEVVDLSPGDPWRLAYLGVLGAVPDELDELLCQRANVEPLQHDEILPIERTSAVGSLDDLLARLRTGAPATPREMCSYFLGSGQDPNTGFFGGQSVVPERWATAQAAGPNIIVVMSDNNVNDFALLWNLRGAWGDSRAMPIGVPRQFLTAEALRTLHEPGVTTFFGWSGGHLYLTSASLGREELSELAAQSSAVEVADPAELLRLGSAPARSHRTVQTWSAGAASIVPLTDADWRVLGAAGRMPSLRAAVQVPDRPVPSLGSLRGRFSPGMVGGAALRQVPTRRSGVVDVRWPSGWTMLSAAAEDRGLEVRASQPGIAAMALLRALGDVHDAYYLSHPEIVSMLYSLAELSGMSWWKNRWQRVESDLRQSDHSPAEIERLATAHGRDDPVVAPPHEGRTLSFSAIRSRIGDRRASEKWITWALDRRLLVKGVDLNCVHCRASFWVSVDELAPPHVCPGCGRTIAQPFRVDTLTFSYRLGEVVRRCLELDAIGHVLALRWLVDLFGDYGLIGAHPGVEFVRDGTVVAEIDVVILLGDGSLVPVEVKRRGAGFDAIAAAQLDGISELIDAPFDVAAVLDSVPEDSALWSSLPKLPERPRFLLTAEHFNTSHIVWAMSANPFDRPRADGDLAAAQHQEWVRAVTSIGERPADPFAITVDLWRDRRNQD